MIEEVKNYIESIKKDTRKYAAIEAVANTEGGRVLISGLKKDLIDTIDNIATNYKDISHVELVALSAKLSAKLSLLRSIELSKKNKELASEALEEAMKNTD